MMRSAKVEDIKDEYLSRIIEAMAEAFLLDGVNPPRGCPMPTWKEQPPAIQAANRRKAHIALTALQASGMAVVPKTAWPPHVSFDVDGGFGLEWDSPGGSLYLVEVSGDADVVWIVRQDGKMLHGKEHKIGSGDGTSATPKASAEPKA